MNTRLRPSFPHPHAEPVRFLAVLVVLAIIAAVILTEYLDKACR